MPHHVPDQVSGDEQDAVLRLGPDEWLVVAAQDRAAEVLTALRGALGDALGSSVDVSANRTTLRLAGPEGREVLEKVCSLDSAPPRVRTGPVRADPGGRTQVVLWQVAAEPAYRLLVRCSFANYLADLLLDAMLEFDDR